MWYATMHAAMHNVTDIVLVDDDDHYREVLSADLADRGFAVACFADGPSFLAAVGNGVQARVALLDWALPEMSGFELLGALRDRGAMPARQVVVDDHLVAGLDEVLDARRANEAGSPDDEQLQSTCLPIAIGPPLRRAWPRPPAAPAWR